MYLSPPGDHERRTDEGDLAPVEGDEPHPEAGYRPKQLVDNEVICRAEVRQPNFRRQPNERYALGAIQHAHENTDKPTHR